MSLIPKPIKDIKKFFNLKFKGIEKKLAKEALELQEVENSIRELKKGNKILPKIDGDVVISQGWSDKKMIKFWLFALMIGLLGYFVYNTLSIIFLIIGAYIISMIVESFVLWLQKLKFNRGLAIILAYIVFVVFFLGILVFVIPFLLTQIAELVSIALGHIAVFQDTLATKGITNIIMDIRFMPLAAKEYFLNYFSNSDLLLQVQNTLQQNLSEIISVGKEYVQLFGSVIMNFVSSFASFMVSFALFITLAILFSVEKVSVMKFLANLSGKDNYDLTYMKLEKMYKKLAVWLKARLVLSLFVTLAMWLALVVMGWFGVEIPNKLGLAIITGLLDIIPYIGPFISGALLFVVGMIYNTIWVAVLAVGILFGVNLVQNNILTPLLMNRALGVNSVLILISMVIGGMIMGFLGVLLAVPIAVIITLLTQDKERLQRDDISGSDNLLRHIVQKHKDKLSEKNSDINDIKDPHAVK